MAGLGGKILFTVLMLLVFRFGSYIPISGIDSVALLELVQRNQNGVLGMFNMLSGGALGRMSIFALGVVPYITSSIVMQILSMTYKPLDDMKKDGEHGRRRVNQITRYLTVCLAAFQAYGIASGLQATSTTHGSIVIISSGLFKAITIVNLVVGTMFLMWLSEQITSRGIGNGTSIVIFTGIVSGFPGGIVSIFELARKGAVSFSAVLFFVGVVCLVLCLIVLVERSYRKVSIQYPKRQSFAAIGTKTGNIEQKDLAGNANYIPMKINTAGVIPPMFAGSILLFPFTIMSLYGAGDSPGGFGEWIAANFARGKLLFTLCYAACIVFFSFFYTAVVFNSEQVAENLKKSGAFIVGKRPGKSTADYFDHVLTRVTVLGACYLCIICIVPEIISSKFSAFSLSGTSLLIAVNVVMDTANQIQSQIFHKKYAALNNKIRIKI